MLTRTSDIAEALYLDAKAFDYGKVLRSIRVSFGLWGSARTTVPGGLVNDKSECPWEQYPGFGYADGTKDVRGLPCNPLSSPFVKLPQYITLGVI